MKIAQEQIDKWSVLRCPADCKELSKICDVTPETIQRIFRTNIITNMEIFEKMVNFYNDKEDKIRKILSIPKNVEAAAN